MIESISFMVSLASVRDVKPSCVCTICPAALNTIVNIVFSFGLFAPLGVGLEYCEFAAVQSFFVWYGCDIRTLFSQQGKQRLLLPHASIQSALEALTLRWSLYRQRRLTDGGPLWGCQASPSYHLVSTRICFIIIVSSSDVLLSFIESSSCVSLISSESLIMSNTMKSRLLS